MHVLLDETYNEPVTLRTSGFYVPGGNDATLSWNNSTRTVLLTPVDPGEEVYDANGNLYIPHFRFYTWDRGPVLQRHYAYDAESELPNPDELQLPAEEGLFAVYYALHPDRRRYELAYTKNPTIDETAELYISGVIVAWLYWDATAGETLYFGDSRHGSEFNPQMHWQQHQTLNSQRQSGLALTNVTYDADGDSNGDYQFGISAGELWHDDIFAETLAVGEADSLPVWYFNAAGDPRFATSAGKKFLNTGSGRVAFNGVTGGLAEAPDQNFVAYHLFATNCVLYPHISAMGQAAHATLGAAVGSIEAEVATLRQDLPHANLMHIASVVLQTSDAFTNTGKAIIVYTSAAEDVFVTDMDFNPATGDLTLFRSANRPPLKQPLDLSTIIHNQIINEGDTIINIINEGGETPGGSNGVNTEFTLNNKPNEYTLRVYLNGVRQHPNSYSVVDKTVIFNDPPWAGDMVQVFYEIYKPSENIGGEVPTGTIDGSNTNFTLTETPDPASINVYLNGILQSSSAYVINGNVVTLNEAPYTGDYIIIDYKTDSAPANTGFNQSPTGLVNGTNTVFTLPVSPTKVMVYLNGVRQLENTHFTHSGDTITFSEAPYSGDWIIVDYEI